MSKETVNEVKEAVIMLLIQRICKSCQMTSCRGCLYLEEALRGETVNIEAYKPIPITQGSRGKKKWKKQK